MFRNYRTFQNHELRHKSSRGQTRGELTADCSTDNLELNSDEDTIVQRQPTNDLSLYSAKWILKMSDTRKLTSSYNWYSGRYK